MKVSQEETVDNANNGAQHHAEAAEPNPGQRPNEGSGDNRESNLARAGSVRPT